MNYIKNYSKPKLSYSSSTQPNEVISIAKSLPKSMCKPKETPQCKTTYIIKYLDQGNLNYYKQATGPNSGLNLVPNKIESRTSSTSKPSNLKQSDESHKNKKIELSYNKMPSNPHFSNNYQSNKFSKGDDFNLYNKSQSSNPVITYVTGKNEVQGNLKRSSNQHKSKTDNGDIHNMNTHNIKQQLLDKGKY